MALVPADATKLVAGATAWQTPASASTNLLEKWHDLFRAYDIQESGTVACSDFVKLEIRNGFEQGDLKRILRAFPIMSQADPSSRGRLDFMDFCKARLNSFDQSANRIVPSVQQLLKIAEHDLATTMLERFRMGPCYSWEIRKELKEVFRCWKSTAEPVLLPSDWLMANKVVETECDAYLTEKWTGERAFQAADTNKDGMIQFEEFVSFSLPLLDATFGRKTNEALQLLKKVCSRERRTLSFTVKVPLFLPHPPYTFQAPTLARHSDCNFYHADDLELPSSITDLPDLLALLRLKLKLVGMSLSAFWQVSEPESLELLCSENASKILISLFDAMAKATATGAANAAIYIKNIRPKPVQLQEVHHQELQLNCLCPHVHPLGMRWHLDWNSHLIGHGRGPLRLPHNFTIGIGDALVLQLPNEESGIAWKVFMTDDGILSKPLLEQVQVVKGKKKTKVIQTIAAENATAEGDVNPKPPRGAKPSKQRPQSGAVRASRVAFDRRLVIIGQKEGVCRLFAEMSWEHQEDTLCHGIQNVPAVEASVGRLGPFQIIVERNSPKPAELQKAKGMAWWIGTRWSPKPVKGKGRPRSAR